jgi:TROVE domain
VSKFNIVDNRKVQAVGPITTAAPAPNYEGATGYARDEKSELFLLAVANMVGESTFYETAGDRDDRYGTLVRTVAVADPEWTRGFLGWLRSDGNMRSASLVGAAEATRAMLAAKVPGGRALIASVLQRADEPGEMLAYWTSTYGRAIPKPVKRGISDAIGRLYTEYALLKYDTGSKGFRFGDVIDLVHPDPAAPWQGHLFKAALDRRHGRTEELGDHLPMLMANHQLRILAQDGSRLLLDSGQLREAGMTWEDVLSLVGSKVDKAELWTALIPTMGYMALLRNLRNFDQAGVSDEIADRVAARLADPAQVAKSRQFPFRFYAAHNAVGSLRWGRALEKALAASLANVPALTGRTLVLVDQSPSMWPGYGMKQQHRDIVNADLAKLFGSAIALRAADATLVGYGGSSHQVPFGKGNAVLTVMGRFSMINATDTFGAVAQHFSGHDRVVIVTDEQNQAGRYRSIDDVIPRHVPAYVWNIGGYAVGSTASGPGRYTFAGLTDHAFRMVPLLESGTVGAWPWLATSDR